MGNTSTNYSLVPTNSPFGYNLGINYESWENGRVGYSIPADLAAITADFQLIRTYHDAAVGTATPTTPVMDSTQQQVISYVTGTSAVELVMGTNNSALAQGGYGTAWSPGLMTSSTYTDAWVQMLISSFGSVAAVQAHLSAILLGNEIDQNGPPPSDPNFASYQTWIQQSFTNLQTSMAAAGLGSIPISTTIANYGSTNVISTMATSYIESHWSSSWNSNSPFVLYNQYTQGTSLGPQSSTDFTPVEQYFQGVENTLAGAVGVYVGETGYTTYYNNPTTNQATVYNQIFAWLDAMETANNGKTIPLFAFDAFDQPSWGDYESDYGIYAQSATYQPAGLKAGIVLPSWVSTPTAQLTSALAARAVALASAGDLGTLHTMVGSGLTSLTADASSVMNLVLTAWNTDAAHDASALSTGLMSRIVAAFTDQGLAVPSDLSALLQMASVVSPGAFNHVGTDLAFASITSSTGPGYDLITGLGIANEALLPRVLTALAHAEAYFHTPGVLAASGSAVTAVASETLLFQPILADNSQVTVSLDGTSHALSGTAGNSYAWSSQFAQQTLQSGFSSALVTLFDHQSQTASFQANVAAGTSVAVGIDGTAATTPQINLSSSSGFVDFVSGDEAVHVARAVAVAETANGASDQTAIIRMRQAGAQDSSVTFYKVDDYSGTINGLKPGDPGYDLASLARAYHTADGGTSVTGAGMGEYSESAITHVNAGDLIAMRLTSGGHTYFAFADGNEVVDGQHVGHLWNYGLNTWGWEDLYGGGDHDYNDLVVQLDFTSSAGHQLLV